MVWAILFVGTSSTETLKSLPGFGKPVNWAPEGQTPYYRVLFLNALNGSFVAK
jgi:hypothetical protein